MGASPPAEPTPEALRYRSARSGYRFHRYDKGYEDAPWITGNAFTGSNAEGLKQLHRSPR